MSDRYNRLRNAPPGFCLAKWYQVTINLDLGVTTSCHHPDWHEIPIDEIKQTPMALHNTNYKMLQRKIMLEGGRPTECNYCWAIENISSDLISDRFIKSYDSWAIDKFDKTLELPWNELVSPAYLELILDNECNLNCSYCVAVLSSSIKKEMEQYGPYIVESCQRKSLMPVNDNKDIFKEAFWKFLPMIAKELKVFRITGGEPLLSKDLFKLLSFIENNPNSSLELIINTNLSYSPILCERLLSEVKVLKAKSAIKKFSLYASIDTLGEQASYVRQGLNLGQFTKNLEMMITKSLDTDIVIMCTFSIFSMFNFKNFLTWIEELKKKRKNITLDISYLENPKYLMANLIDRDNLTYLTDSLEYMQKSCFFTQYEISKFERVVEWIKVSVPQSELEIYRADFYTFVTEHDRRFKKSFESTFPEAISFLNLCKKNIFPRQFLGLGKTKYNSSACLIERTENIETCEIYLTERLDRRKSSGLWPEIALRQINFKLKKTKVLIADNREMQTPTFLEEVLDRSYPFYDHLKNNSLDTFVRKFNDKIINVSHHLAHAYAALAISPFNESIIVVMDGAGNATGNEKEFEECSVYIQKRERLELIKSRTIKFVKTGNAFWGDGVGSFYEKASEFIFNNQTSSGKVMGLAAFGKPNTIDNIIEYQKKINWQGSWKGKSKQEWEQSREMCRYTQLASDVQLYLENNYEQLLKEIKQDHLDIKNLILTGGCALNCTNNAKIYYSKLFENVYVPPFPGDESIGFGLAKYLQIRSAPQYWKPVDHKDQTAYWGPLSSMPTSEAVEKVFLGSQYKIKKHEKIEVVVSNLLVEGKVVAWFQGRSEAGPRALGNRSILVRPDRKGIKNYLNQKIKFRESFRPYGCSVLFEFSQEYFEVDSGFENPFMSFAVKTKESWKEKLTDITHVDGTSRMQTVRYEQNNRFYNLIKSFGDKTGIYCLLNTSLNVMNEPIVETTGDAERFFSTSEVDALVVGDYVILKD